MTIRYVGIGGSDSNDGLSWANRKQTLNGVEDTPVVAGDTVYVGPGTYYYVEGRLTIDVAGSSGSTIKYIGDVTGINTDGIGGIVRLTGTSSASKDDSFQAYMIDNTASEADYREFSGFFIDGFSSRAFFVNAFDGWVIEDCIIDASPAYSIAGIYLLVSATTVGDNIAIRRCLFRNTSGDAIYFYTTVATRQLASTVENCIFEWTQGVGVRMNFTYGVTIKNCTFMRPEFGYSDHAVEVANTITANKVYFYNNIIYRHTVSSGSGYNSIMDDYNIYVTYDDGSPTWGYDPGANTEEKAMVIAAPILRRGFAFPMPWHEVSPESPLLLYGCGQTPPSEDFFGLPRPSTDSKKTRGAIQYQYVERDTTTVPTGEEESIKFADAGVHQIFIPITGKSMKFTIEVYREANYAGTNPQMIIKQPGQSDQITTDAGAASQFNQLSDTHTPSDIPTYVVLELKSNNTATSGSYGVYFGKLTVK